MDEWMKMIEQVRKRRRADPIVRLLISGYEPSGSELLALADLLRDHDLAPRRSTAADRNRKIKSEYRKLRDDGVPVFEAEDRLAERYRMDEVTIHNILRRSY